MRILQYIPQKEATTGYGAQYLSLLNHALSKVADVEVVSSYKAFKLSIKE